MNIRLYWSAVRKKAAELDPEAAALDAAETDPQDRVHLEKLSEREIVLTSLDSDHDPLFKPNVVVSAKPWTAAQWMVGKTHRLSTEPEITAWREMLAERRTAILAAEEAKGTKGVTLRISSESLSAALAGMAPAKKGATS